MEGEGRWRGLAALKQQYEGGATSNLNLFDLGGHSPSYERVRKNGGEGASLGTLVDPQERRRAKREQTQSRS